MRENDTVQRFNVCAEFGVQFSRRVSLSDQVSNKGLVKGHARVGLV